ncbi:TetR/AcrR family transcriptional regulator [Streptomyces sp. NPDC003717]|uniref:TetR/AcrR family transcriptional regulator n=1 Tax=Streptomyces sp. NPDC003717 TaxID=3154276 RepID=UPI0033AAC93F
MTMGSEIAGAERPAGRARREDTRDRVVRTAARLLTEGGTDAVTTRAVAQAAGLQPPALYRLFADKDALLDAAVEHVYAEHVAAKRSAAADSAAGEEDPVAQLRAGWRTQIEFGLANPAAFLLTADPVRAGKTPALARGMEVLRERVRRVAAAGRLAVAEQRAVDLIHAAGTGALHTLLALPPERRDPGLADALFDAVARSVLTDAPALPTDDTAAAVTAFRALVPRLPRLSPAEAALLDEWLGRDRGGA